ncbi:MAG TPA: hypothetical protein VGA56_20205 [Opitutaceae bacterium]
MGDRERVQRRGKVWIEFERFLEELLRAGDIGLRQSEVEFGGTQEKVVGLGIVRGTPPNPRLLAPPQLDVKLGDDGSHDLVLNRENVIDRAIEAIGPHMLSGHGIDELHIDPDSPARS